MNKMILSAVLIFLSVTSFAHVPVWKTYINKPYHCKISYPANLTTRHVFSGAYFFSRGWSVNSHQENGLRQHSLFEIQLDNFHGSDQNHEGYYFESYVRVGVSTLPFDLAHCETSAEILAAAKPASVLVNGKKFMEFTVADAAMSQYVAGDVYRRLQKGKCYSVEYLETGSNTQHLAAYDAMKAHSQALGKQIISTVKLF